MKRKSYALFDAIRRRRRLSCLFGAALVCTLALVLGLSLSGGILSASASGSVNMIYESDENGNLVPLKGYRPYLEFNNKVTNTMTRHQVIKVYAYAGETLMLGTSVADRNNTNANINMRSEIYYRTPQNKDNQYLQVTSGGTGHINSLAKERIGPHYTDGKSVEHGVGGFEPIIFYCEYEGVYEFEFTGFLSGEYNPTETKISAPWSTNGSTVAAWNITVVQNYSPNYFTYNSDGSIVVDELGAPVQTANRNYKMGVDSKEISGRVFANCLFLSTGQNSWTRDDGLDGVLYSTLYVLTDDGFIYEVELNGIDPYGFVMFANSRGLIDATTGMSLYASARDSDAKTEAKRDVVTDLRVKMPTGASKEVQFHLPNMGDTELDVTYPIFFEKPSDDLPETIKPTAIVPDARIEAFTFSGYNSQDAYVNSGGVFTFEQYGADTFDIMISIDEYTVNGETRPASTVHLSGSCIDGVNYINWDGKDGNGYPLPAGTYGQSNADFGASVTIVTKAGEYHFPMIDIENSVNGVRVTRLTHPVIGYDANGDEIFPEMTDEYIKECSTVYFNNTYIVDTKSDANGNVIEYKPITLNSYLAFPEDNIAMDDIDYSASGYYLYDENGDPRGASAFYAGKGSIDSISHSTRSASFGGDDAVIDIWTYYKAKTETLASFTLREGNTASIKGFVYFDKIANFPASITREDGDCEFSDIEVELYDSNGAKIGNSVRTDELGNYYFFNVEKDKTYTVKIKMPYPDARVTEPLSAAASAEAVGADGVLTTGALTAGMNQLGNVGIHYDTHPFNIRITKDWQTGENKNNLKATFRLDCTYVKDGQTLEIPDAEPGVENPYEFSCELSSSNNWNHTFINLPKLYDGCNIIYTPVENTLDGWLSVCLYPQGSLTNNGTLRVYDFINYPLKLQVTKRLYGEPDSSKVFKFEVYEATYNNGVHGEQECFFTNGEPLCDDTSSTGSADGVTFDLVLPFSSLGSETEKTFYYGIKELADSEDPGYIYDNKTYYYCFIAKIIHDSTGSYLEVTGIPDGNSGFSMLFDSKGTPIDGITFVNSAARTLTVTKNWNVEDGSPVANQEAKFSLYRWKLDADNKPTAVTLVDGNRTTVNQTHSFGRRDFADLSNGEAFGDTYYYGVSEVNTSDGYIVTANTDPIQLTYNNRTVTVFPYHDTTDLIITNTRKTSLTVNKVWLDGNDAANHRPLSVTAALSAKVGGEAIELPAGIPAEKPISGDSAVSWQTVWTDLPMFTLEGESIDYYISEKDPDSHYRVSYSPAGGAFNASGVATITNLLLDDITVTKVWADSGVDHSGDIVNVALYRDDVIQSVVTLPDGSGALTHTWASLPAYEPDGTAHAYSVREGSGSSAAEFEPFAEGASVAFGGVNYIVSYTNPARGQYTITNSNGAPSLTVVAAWHDNNNAYLNRPESLPVTLHAWVTPAGEDEPLEITDKLSGFEDINNKALSGAWSSSWMNLPSSYVGDDGSTLEITYTVTQDATPTGYDPGAVAYTMEGNTLYISNTLQTIGVPIVKLWGDKENAYGNRPNSVTVNLAAKIRSTGREVPSSALSSETLSLTITQSDSFGTYTQWARVKTGLPIYYNLESIDYTIAGESTIVGYDAYTVNTHPSWDNAKKAFSEGVLTNTLTTIKVSGTNKWVDNGKDHSGDSVTIYLYRSDNPDKPIDSMNVSNANGWTHSWNNLPTRVNGAPVTYSVGDSPVAGYTSVLSGYDFVRSATSSDNNNVPYTGGVIPEPPADDGSAFPLWALLGNIVIVLAAAGMIISFRIRKRSAAAAGSSR